MTLGSTTNLELTTAQARDVLPEEITKDNFESLDQYVAATRLTNKSGGTVIAGTVVVPGSVDNSFTTTTTASNPKVIGVVQESIDNDAAGILKHYGTTTVRVNATTAIGDWLVTSSSAGVAAPVTQTNPPNGAFAMALTARTGAGTVVALLLSVGITGSLVAPASTAPTPTTDGAIEWDSNDNFQVWGDGSSQKYFFPDNKGADITAASIITIGSDAVYEVTGTTTITGATSNPAGQRVMLIFASAVTLTYNSTSFKLRESRSRVTVPGEVIQLLSLGSGNWQEISTGTTAPKVATADQSVISTTTLTSSTYLTHAVEANSSYDFEIKLVTEGNASQDIKVGILGPTSAAAYYGAIGDLTAAGVFAVAKQDIAMTTPVTTSFDAGAFIVLTGTIITGATAGSVTLQFAQDVSGANNCTIKKGSTFRLTKVL